MATAAVLAVVLVVGLVVVLAFVFEIRRLVGDTADAMEEADAGTARLAAHLSGLQGATSAAAGELPTRRA